jgi:hypothetical protein
VQSVDDTESAAFDERARRALDLMLLYNSNIMLGRSFLGNFVGTLHAPAKVVRATWTVLPAVLCVHHALVLKRLPARWCAEESGAGGRLPRVH